MDKEIEMQLSFKNKKISEIINLEAVFKDMSDNELIKAKEQMKQEFQDRKLAWE